MRQVFSPAEGQKRATISGARVGLEKPRLDCQPVRPPIAEVEDGIFGSPFCQHPEEQQDAAWRDRVFMIAFDHIRRRCGHLFRLDRFRR